MEEIDWRGRILAEFAQHPQRLHLANAAILELENALQRLASMGFPLHIEEGPPTKKPSVWPRFMFHIRQGSKIVLCEADWKEMGPDWYPSMDEARHAAGEAKQWQRGGVFTKSLPAPIDIMEMLRPKEPPPQQSRNSMINAMSPPRYGLPAVVGAR